MCSNASPRIPVDLAIRLRAVIDELAAEAAADQPAAGDLATRLAAAWALIADVDPELADRAARYTR
jgi:hypothetical protein